MDITLLDVLKSLGNMGGLAVFSWAIYKLHIKSLDDHKQDLSEERKLFKEEAAAQRETAKEESAEQRDLFREQMAAERAMCQEHHRQQQETSESILETLNNLEARGK